MSVSKQPLPGILCDVLALGFDYLEVAHGDARKVARMFPVRAVQDVVQDAHAPVRIVLAEELVGRVELEERVGHVDQFGDQVHTGIKGIIYGFQGGDPLGDVLAVLHSENPLDLGEFARFLFVSSFPKVVGYVSTDDINLFLSVFCLKSQNWSGYSTLIPLHPLLSVLSPPIL